jgi:hypothetical protein
LSPTFSGRDPLYWAAWLLAAGFTGIVAGLMLGHALLLAPFLDWLLAAGRPELFAQTYPRFRGAEGRAGLGAYYLVVALQVIAAAVFTGVALVRRRHRVAAVIAGAAGAGWVLIHYASGFGALEAQVVRGEPEPLPGVVPRFVAWNTPIHYVHALALTVALAALLTVPLSALRQRG